MKALIVIDLPDGIELDEYIAFINVERMSISLGALGNEKIYSDYFKFKFKPLRPMPKRAFIDQGVPFNEGWNACLDAITGETE